jgi:hypothetical protein
MNGMRSHMAEIMQYFSYNTNLWIILLTAFVCGILLVFLVLLIFRKIRLWYWKVDLQVNTLKEIDEKLMTLETEIKEKKELIDEKHINQLMNDLEIAHYDEKGKQLIDGTIEIVSCRSKSGRIYTEKELEELIKT